MPGAPASLEERFRRIGWTETESGCWEWNGSRAKRGGYGQISGRGTVLKTHRLSHELHIGPIPEGHFVLHSCDNPPCVNPAHLRSGTPEENTADMWSRGRGFHMSASGEFASPAKLTWDQVLEIRSSPETGVALAKRFGVTKSAISSIRTGKTWKTRGEKHGIRQA